MWFIQLTAWIFFNYLVAGHMTEPGSLLTEPGAVIECSHSVTPVHVRYNMISSSLGWWLRFLIPLCIGNSMIGQWFWLLLFFLLFPVKGENVLIFVCNFTEMGNITCLCRVNSFSTSSHNVLRYFIKTCKYIFIGHQYIQSDGLRNNIIQMFHLIFLNDYLHPID